jgi:cytosine/uracil/thiamine/allantoin permease
VAGIYISDHFLFRRGQYAMEDLEREPAINWAALASWGLAATLEYASSRMLVPGSGVPSVDSLVLALALYVALRRWVPALRPAGVSRASAQ